MFLLRPAQSAAHEVMPAPKTEPARPAFDPPLTKPLSEYDFDAEHTATRLAYEEGDIDICDYMEKHRELIVAECTAVTRREIEKSKKEL